MPCLRWLPALALFLALSVAHAQETPWYDPDPLPQGMTAEEMTRRHEIGLGFEATTPPPGPIRNIAEFEPSQAVLVRYPLGIPLALVAALSEQLPVITLVSSASQQAQATSAYQNAGVHMANAQFLIKPTDSIWTRDYGPFYIADGNDQVGIIDFVYNRPRPNDNTVPGALSAYLDLPIYAMDLVHTGGNYMTDSDGTSASTELVYEENGFNEPLVLQRMQAYLGVHTYHVTIDPQATYLKHIDTWAKFLDVDKILIAEVPVGHPRYADHEAVADYFATQLSAYGTPYQVFRVYTPSGQPYTNSLIVNDRVYVPIMNSSWDQDALDVYAEAMPGYEILPFTGSWLSTDALHCRVKEVADDEMIYLQHQPLAGEVPYQPSFTLDVDVTPYSGEALDEDELFLIYRIEEASFDSLALQHAGGDTYTATLPVPQGDVEVSYYFSATDAAGRTDRFPLVGPEGARSFYVLPESDCEQSLVATLDDANPTPGEVVTFAVTVTNGGAGPAPLDLWLDASGPISRTVRLGGGTLPAGATVTRNVGLRIPSNAPGGPYDLDLHIGTFPGDVCDTVPFTLTVQGARLGGDLGAAFEALAPEDDLFATAAVEAPTHVVVTPNPFRAEARIHYTVPVASNVRLMVYDVLGREIARLVDGVVEVGDHTAVFDARELASGPYLCRLEVGDHTEVRQMLVVR